MSVRTSPKPPLPSASPASDGRDADRVVVHHVEDVDAVAQQPDDRRRTTVLDRVRRELAADQDHALRQLAVRGRVLGVGLEERLRQLSPEPAELCDRVERPGLDGLEVLRQRGERDRRHALSRV